MPRSTSKTVAKAPVTKPAADAPRGIQWSAPVLVRREAQGLAVSLPAQVVKALAIGEGDVLNFTELPGGSIEVWRVKKSTYSSLADLPAKAPAKKKSAAKRGGRS